MANELGASATRAHATRNGIFEFVRKRAGITGLFLVLLLLALTASLISEAFLNPFNLVNVLRQVALYGIVSIGLTFVILTAGIDLSVGSIVAVVSVVTATLLNAGLGVPVVILAGLGLGLLFGHVHDHGFHWRKSETPRTTAGRFLRFGSRGVSPAPR